MTSPNSKCASDPILHADSHSMLGFKSKASSAVILSGIEMVHMMRKRQARFAYNPCPSIAEQFEILAA
jgi:putative transposase